MVFSFGFCEEEKGSGSQEVNKKSPGYEAHTNILRGLLGNPSGHDTYMCAHALVCVSESGRQAAGRLISLAHRKI
jgi:hypothetical protein